MSALSAAALISTESGAFSAENHARYAALALQRHGPCLLPRVGDRNSTHAFVTGTWAEDKTQLWSRLTNWHYARNDAMSERTVALPLPVISRTSFGKRFAERVQELLLARADPSKAFEAAGRITHYVQDMRNPAHVIPIHHGSVYGHDAIDEYFFTYGDLPPPHDCGSLKAMYAVGVNSCNDEFHNYTATLWGLAADARRETQRMVDSVDHFPGCNEPAAKLFWCTAQDVASDLGSAMPKCRPAIYGGFGSYRFRATFGDVGGGVCGQHTTHAHYHEYYRDSYVGMMEDIAKVFAYAAGVLDCRPAPTEAGLVVPTKATSWRRPSPGNR